MPIIHSTGDLKGLELYNAFQGALCVFFKLTKPLNLVTFFGRMLLNSVPITDGDELSDITDSESRDSPFKPAKAFTRNECVLKQRRNAELAPSTSKLIPNRGNSFCCKIRSKQFKDVSEVEQMEHEFALLAVQSNCGCKKGAYLSCLVFFILMVSSKFQGKTSGGDCLRQVNPNPFDFSASVNMVLYCRNSVKDLNPEQKYAHVMSIFQSTVHNLTELKHNIGTFVLFYQCILIQFMTCMQVPLG